MLHAPWDVFPSMGYIKKGPEKGPRWNGSAWVKEEKTGFSPIRIFTTTLYISHAFIRGPSLFGFSSGPRATPFPTGLSTGVVDFHPEGCPGSPSPAVRVPSWLLQPLFQAVRHPFSSFLVRKSVV